MNRSESSVCVHVDVATYACLGVGDSVLLRVRRMNSHYRKHSLLSRAHFPLSPTRSPSTRVAPVATHGTAVPIAIQLILQNTPNTYIALTQTLTLTSRSVRACLLAAHPVAQIGMVKGY
jgi:hypothetical protein